MKNKFGPCIEKNCSVCCNPVKTETGFPDEKIPKNKKKQKIWKKREEIWLPEHEIDSTKLEVFDCQNFDKKTGKCKDYENRPDICRNTSCIDANSSESADDQYKKFSKIKFVPVSTKPKCKL